MQANPVFTVYCGPMFSSKTSRLLMELERYKYQREKTVVFKPQIDTRYSTSEIVTHGGWKHHAICVKDGSDVLKYLADMDDDPRVVAVDEAFMIPGIAEVLIFLYQSGFNIVVSTLDMASNGKPFPEVVQMLPWATKIEKCTAVCTVCGDDAYFTHKKTVGGDEFVVEVGGDELYEPRCASHFPVIFDHKLKK
jgi:thymidine kinase